MATKNLTPEPDMPDIKAQFVPFELLRRWHFLRFPERVPWHPDASPPSHYAMIHSLEHDTGIRLEAGDEFIGVDKYSGEKFGMYVYRCWRMSKRASIHHCVGRPLTEPQDWTRDIDPDLLGHKGFQEVWFRHLEKAQRDDWCLRHGIRLTIH